MVTGRLRQRSWETPEGDKRSVTEIEADEVGASLKWAAAKRSLPAVLTMRRRWVPPLDSVHTISNISRVALKSKGRDRWFWPEMPNT
jgi:hypothetical protein